MVVVLEKLFIAQLTRCPADFQLKFRKAYQQLKVVDTPLELKSVSQIEKKLFKLIVDKAVLRFAPMVIL
ncbi:MAG: hypothetical protein ABJB86_16825 [Bacteroidota bacterium]